MNGWGHDPFLTDRQRHLIREAIQDAMTKAREGEDDSPSGGESGALYDELVETFETFKEVCPDTLVLVTRVEAEGYDDPDPRSQILVREFSAVNGVIVAIEGHYERDGKFAVRWTDDYDQYPRLGEPYVPQPNDRWYPVAAFSPFTHEDEAGYGTENYPSGYVDIRQDLNPESDGSA